MPIRLQTIVEAGHSRMEMSTDDRILCVGSCFADNIGKYLKESGLDVRVNPFGPLYNPVSVSNAIARLDAGTPFDESDCVEMGAGAGLIGSFSHYTKLARPTKEEFLADANASLSEASAFWHNCDKVIITIGTAWCWRWLQSGEIVANCLKRPAKEFSHERLSSGHIEAILSRLVARFPEKKFILTVSPIRHLSEGREVSSNCSRTEAGTCSSAGKPDFCGAHANQISKAALLQAVDSVCASHPGNAEYFPSYEIMLDELRDYRFYAEDLVHPSDQAIRYICERFCMFAFSDSGFTELQNNRKALPRQNHRPITQQPSEVDN